MGTLRITKHAIEDDYNKKNHEKLLCFNKMHFKINIKELANVNFYFCVQKNVA